MSTTRNQVSVAKRNPKPPESANITKVKKSSASSAAGAFSQDMKNTIITRYNIEKKLPCAGGRSVTLAYFTDMHSCCGPQERGKILRLLDRIGPDAVLCGGDSFVARPGEPVEPAARFLGEIAERYLLLIGTGNHEYRTRIYPEQYGTMYEEYRRILRDSGAHVLEDRHIHLRLGGVPFDISGFDMPRKYYGRLRRTVIPEEEIAKALGRPDPDAVSVLLAHSPGPLGAYLSWGADLTLCGHYHGGIMRIGRHHGLISPEFRLFPSNAYGHFQKNGKHAIISSGCGEHSLPLRIHNPREVVAVGFRLTDGGETHGDTRKIAGI